MDYIKAITRRESIRSFKNKSIQPQTMKAIKACLAQDYSVPFGHAIRFELIDINQNNGMIGTYGIIKNAQGFIAGMTHNTNQSMLDFGYAFEELILQLTCLDIGTCWLGGTFKIKDFNNTITLAENEIIPCISPIGFAKNKKRLLDRLMRRFAGSDDRKAWSDLFFYQTFDTPLDPTQCQSLKKPLEMLRRSPSASNRQPWRILVTEDCQKVHFFIKRDKQYKKTFDYDIQLIDIGIAMNHFEKSAKQLGLVGQWTIESTPKDVEPFEYVTTYIFD
jgi:nitroreductase